MLEKQESQEYYLVDINYTGKKDDGEFYGINLISNHNLSHDRFRFLTGVSATREEAEIRFSMESGHPVDLVINKRLQLFKPRFEHWLNSILIHPESKVFNTMNFYASPWNEKKHFWYHDDLQNSNGVVISRITNWLTIEPEELTKDKGESAKSLFLWHGDPQSQNLWGSWSEIYEYRRERHLQGKILKKVCKKLGINIILGDSIAGENWMRMPCTPCLPFLVSLKSFLWFLEIKDQRPIEALKLNKFEGDNADAYVLSLKLQDINKNDPWGLTEYFYSTNQKDTEHTTTKHLKSLTRCQTIGLSDKKNDEQPCMRLFREGTPKPVVSVEFAPYHIHLMWTAGKSKLEEEF